MPLEYLVVIIIIIILVPRPGPRPPGPGPDPAIDIFITNVQLAGVAGLIMSTAAAFPEETFSLRYGPLLLFPAFQVLAGLYQNNTAVPAALKAKM